MDATTATAITHTHAIHTHTHTHTHTRTHAQTQIRTKDTRKAHTTRPGQASVNTHIALRYVYGADAVREGTLGTNVGLWVERVGRHPV